MSQLAIKGHATRGREVIQLLEMLGGKNIHRIDAIRDYCVYFVMDDKNKTISSLKLNQVLPEQFIIYSLEEFEEKFPYKVGDKVYNIIHNENQTITEVAWDFQEDEIVYQTNNNDYLFVNYLQPYEEETMEQIKIDIGSAKPYENETSIEIRGRNVVDGLPKNVTITSAEIRGAILDTIYQIIDAIRLTLEKTPPELAADIIDTGITLTGGTALLRGLAELIAEETGMPVSIAANPLDCVVLGAKKRLEGDVGFANYTFRRGKKFR